MPNRPTIPQVRPCLAELLRTCVQPASLVMRVERILTECSKHDGDNKTGQLADECEPLEQRAYRLWLSDGQLMVQGVLSTSVHRIFEAEEVSLGSILDIRKFVVRRAKRRCGQGEIVYLGIQHFETVLSANPATLPAVVNQDNEGGFIRDETCAEDARSAQRVPRSTPPISEALTQEEVENMLSAPSSQESNGFESTELDREAIKRKRDALRELSRNTQPSRITLLHQPGSPRKRRKVVSGTIRSTTTSPAKSVCSVQPATARELDRSHFAGYDQQTPTIIPAHAPQPRPTSAGSPSSKRPPSGPTPADTSSAHRPHTPAEPPFHTLASLLNPAQDASLPSRNYACSVLGLISWVSPNIISNPNKSFPAKRHIKIRDLSITGRSDGVTIAVFIDATTFLPEIGAIALFKGVVMNTVKDDIILNVYASLRGREWYVAGEGRLEEMGYGDDVKQLRDWWAERSTGTRNAG